MNALQEMEGSEMVPCYFRFTGDARHVFLCGSFNDWAPLAMEKNADVFGRGVFWERTVLLPLGRHEFKFRRDDMWTLDPDVVSSMDAIGNVNHYVVVTSPPPAEGEQVVGEETQQISSSAAPPIDASVSADVITPDATTAAETADAGKNTTEGEDRSPSPMVRIIKVPEASQSSSVAQATSGVPAMSLSRSSSSGSVVKPAVSWISRQKQSAARWHTPEKTTADSPPPRTQQQPGQPPAVPTTTQPGASGRSAGALPDVVEGAVTSKEEEGGGGNSSSMFSQRLRNQQHIEWNLDVNNNSNNNEGGKETDDIGNLDVAGIQHTLGIHARMGRSVSSTELSSSGKQSLGNGKRHSGIDANRVLRDGPGRFARYARRSMDSRMDTDALNRQEHFSVEAIAGARERMKYASSKSAGHAHQLPHDTLAPNSPRMKGLKPITASWKATSRAGQSILQSEGKVLIALVGLPARGKTYIANIVKRHMNWKNHTCALVNVGNYRRDLFGSQQSSGFFDPSNVDGAKSREEAAHLALMDALSILGDEENNTDIVIYDATNTTKKRRKWICETVARVQAEKQREQQLREEDEDANAEVVDGVEDGVDAGGVNRSGSWSASSWNGRDGDGLRQLHVQVMFLEIICDDQGIIRSNVLETKMNSPDYRGVSQEKAVEDFLSRIKHYESVYEPLDDVDEGDMSYLKLINVGKRLVCNNMQGFFQGQLMSLLVNLHITPRPIFLVRHGESMDNVKHRVGGDSSLTPLGSRFARLLGGFFANLFPDAQQRRKVPIWTSTLARTAQTVAHMSSDHPLIKWRHLDEIDAGQCEGLTYEEIAAVMPEVYTGRQNNKWEYRWPGGESYADLFVRLEPVILEMIRHKGPLIVVAHQAVLRVIYGYLNNLEPAESPTVSFPQHAVVQLTPKAYGCEEVVHEPLVTSV